MGRVVLFRPRAALRRGANQHAAGSAGHNPTLIADLAKYEHTEDTDDFRHRMIVNVIAFLFIVMLTATGIWLAETIAAMRKTQDCILSGRRNCAPIDIQARDR